MHQVATASLESPAASRVRYGVLGFACGLSMITYLDRVCVASAAPAMVHDLGLQSVADLKWVFTAFALAYSLCEVPSGWLGDVFGPRRVLIRIVLWWSVFTALTGVVGLSAGGVVLGGLGTLVLVRFLFGMGEAGAYPNITRALHNWFPPQQRGFAQGAVWMCGRLMGGLTPLVWMLLVEGIRRPATDSGGRDAAVSLLPPLMHWRAVFWTFGLIGTAWCVLFAVWFRNRPEEKSTVNAAELAWIRSGQAHATAVHADTPWRQVLLSRNLWTLGLMYACQSYGWYFYITYLPEYLACRYDVPATSTLGAIYKGGPLWLGAAGCLVGGLLTDWFLRRTGNLRWSRRLFGVVGLAGSGVCFLLCPAAPTAFWLFVTISLAGFCTDFTMGAGWSTCQDIGRRHAGVVAGFMNMVGNFGGAVASWMFGFILQQSLDAYAARLRLATTALSAAEKTAGLLHGYQINFLIAAVIYGVGALCWLRIDPAQPVAAENGQMPESQ